MPESSTHFVFNETGVFISPDIYPVINFLQEIEKEIESILNFNNKLDGITENYLEMIDFVKFLSEKLADNNIDFKYTFKEDPEKIAEKLQFHLPLRSLVIVLFASLEVLFTLDTAYSLEDQDPDSLRKHTLDPDLTRKFLNCYLLTSENKFYEEHKARLSRIDAGKLRGLRNSLTHFFSIGHGGLSLAPDQLSNTSRKFENILKANKRGNVVFISEQDLYGLIRSANHLRLKRWSNDFETDPDSFKRKILCVINVVEKEGARIVHNPDLRFKQR